MKADVLDRFEEGYTRPNFVRIIEDSPGTSNPKKLATRAFVQVRGAMSNGFRLTAQVM